MKRVRKRDIKRVLQVVEMTATLKSKYLLVDKVVLVWSCKQMTGYDGLSPIITMLKQCGWNTVGEFDTAKGNYTFRIAVPTDELPDQYQPSGTADA
jgi:hypothetical protein